MFYVSVLLYSYEYLSKKKLYSYEYKFMMNKISIGIFPMPRFYFQATLGAGFLDFLSLLGPESKQILSADS